MAFGIDDAILLMMAAASTAQAMNPPENHMKTAGQPTGAMPGKQPLAPASPSTPDGMQSVQPIQTDALTSLAQELAKTGSPPPTQPSTMPTTGAGTQTLPPATPPATPAAAPASPGWKSLLQAAPAAIAMAAPLLGLTDQPGRKMTAPIAGGGPGGPMMQSPIRRPSLGEILSSLRM